MGFYLSKEPRSATLGTAQGRRKCLAAHPIIKQRQSIPNVQIISEYVETSDGHIIFCKCFRPENKSTEIKGMICFCGGYGSYTDWTNSDFAENFVNRGYIVIAYDHWGHGRSDGVWMSTKDGSFHTWTDDAIFIFERAKRKYTPSEMRSTMKYFLLGHSLGGAIAIQVSKKYTKKYYPTQMIGDENEIKEKNVDEYLPSIITDKSDYGWNGMLLCAPMVKILDKLRPNIVVQKVLEYLLLPLFPHARMIPSKSFESSITRDVDYCKMLSKSPMIYDEKPTLNLGMSILQMCTDIEQNMNDIRLPFMLLHGSDDQVIDPEMSRFLAGNCGCDEVTFKMYEHGYHALMLDLDREQVFADMCEWMQEH